MPPSQVCTPLERDVGKLGMEHLTGALVIRCCSSDPLPINSPEIAIYKFDRFRLWPGLPVTDRTGTARRPHSAALRTDRKPWSIVALARSVSRIYGAPIFLEGPGNVFRDQAVFVDPAGVVQDDAVIFAGRRAQAPANHLPVQAEVLRGPGQDQVKTP
jgi:hypothetical protein